MADVDTTQRVRNQLCNIPQNVTKTLDVVYIYNHSANTKVTISAK